MMCHGGLRLHGVYVWVGLSKMVVKTLSPVYVEQIIENMCIDILSIPLLARVVIIML